ncbi:hypothetical protein [Rubellimicrobium roseum]|uniref:Uncharacterized protein n=1 Tax=Rubellimicrobium roseum TaxID=687525 RepID=A0A5C4ND74_9RHOB|nr:hypothetical protein [Rubellimicrobium roseum]TNC66298.1 hypothetical protein FHG71_16950 [Rubellimicrobium roseum]
MAKQARPLPVMESITVEQICPICGEANWLSLKDVEGSDQYKCQQCHAAVQLVPEDASDLRDRIARKFADIIRLG